MEKIKRAVAAFFAKENRLDVNLLFLAKKPSDN